MIRLALSPPGGLNRASKSDSEKSTRSGTSRGSVAILENFLCKSTQSTILISLRSRVVYFVKSCFHACFSLIFLSSVHTLHSCCLRNTFITTLGHHCPTGKFLSLCGKSASRATTTTTTTVFFVGGVGGKFLGIQVTFSSLGFPGTQKKLRGL